MLIRNKPFILKIETRFFFRVENPCSDVSGLKTGCSKSYVCSETSIFSCSSPLPPFFNLFSTTPIFPCFLFLSKTSFFFLYMHVPVERTTVYNGADEWSKEFLSSFFLSLFLVSFFIYLRLSLWEIPVRLLNLRWSYNALRALGIKSRLWVKFNKPWIPRN